MLALDLDLARARVDPGVDNNLVAARAEVEHQAAELGQLLAGLGAQYLADVSPSGGRHVFVLFAAPLPWRELRDIARALAFRFPAIDTAPMASLGGQISPPGSRHRSGGWRVLSSPEAASAAVEHPNGPEVWDRLLTELAAELRQVEQPRGGTQQLDPGCTKFTDEAKLDDTGVP
jgi:hypothetical protein